MKVSRFFLAAVVVLLVGCSSKDAVPEGEFTSVKGINVREFDSYEPGSASIEVEATAAWKVTVDDNWIHTSVAEFPVGKSTLVITVDENDGDAREGRMVLRCGLDSRTVKIRQKKASGNTVKGRILYSDGKPAEGVAVSNGFDVTSTDAQGNYKMSAGPDVRYIYYSYPSDSKVERDEFGRPSFFEEYSAMKVVYDFTIRKAAGEQSFNIFAMADPQAHYKVRGSQKKPDTDRFSLETVPAVNNEIASSSLPCYGITLGDIVYSENDRNSTAGMPIMREHFSRVNMPVFQTMGNHDYTYFYTTNELMVDETSSTLHLKAQRKFEETFGPINYSFNRGQVHFVCMRDIIYGSTTKAGTYHGGFTDEQYEWLSQDLSYVSKDKMVVLCVHIPIVGQESKEHVQDVMNLLKQYKNPTVLAGHTHHQYYRGQTGVLEHHVLSAVCGQWWWSNVEGDGCPNGYTIFTFDGTQIKNSVFMGVNGEMARKENQIRIYRGGMTTGGPYTHFLWTGADNELKINVFNGDSRWKVRVYENNVLSGEATLMSQSKKTFDSVSASQTYGVPVTSSQDWWAIGYNIGCVGRGISSTSYYTTCHHMYKYSLKDKNALVRVEAEDPYGNIYTCSHITTELYPSYIICENNW